MRVAQITFVKSALECVMVSMVGIWPWFGSGKKCTQCRQAPAYWALWSPIIRTSIRSPCFFIFLCESFSAINLMTIKKAIIIKIKNGMVKETHKSGHFNRAQSRNLREVWALQSLVDSKAFKSSDSYRCFAINKAAARIECKTCNTLVAVKSRERLDRHLATFEHDRNARARLMEI